MSNSTASTTRLSSDDTSIRPYRIDVPQAAIDDLRDRLARTRFAEELPPSELADLPAGGPVMPGWQYGVPGAAVRELVDRWRDDFDWRRVEAELNARPHFTTAIDGQDIHFVHVRSPEADATPLILTHGWPNTFVEFMGLVDELTDPRAHGADPADAVHVVIPDLPGFGFSGPTHERGWDAARTARAWAELMRRLGYDRYVAHGNDAGAIVAPLLGQVDGAHVIGVHVDQIFSFPNGEPGELDGLTAEELAPLEFAQSFLERAIHDSSQRAQPQTIAHALADSPVGQLAWILQLLAGQDPDVILTNASIYWFTNTAASSARFYFENHHARRPAERTAVPLALSSFAFDMSTVRRFAERDHANIVTWTEHDRGSHWAAHDAPDLVVEDLRRFVRLVRRDDD
ncbi:epoxide hydrolase family protein [Actinomarinicola tropica]|uniref:Alpha/beta fold hydrolase n=1 Tax=Actinomarinicola tropica TaxID=2789776 RepID=A0A5Q2RHI2_9ACTN|nr:epoxide hydrolase family protein [Actinomarinicola tropica]QGG95233.1 alpha/beta fold hydrolase [Actinomarinicola tropica]